MEIDGQHPVGPRFGNQIGDQLGRDRRPRSRFAVLPGIAEIGDDCGDPLGRGPAQGIDTDQQFHQIVVGGMAGRLDDKYILAADILVNFDENLVIGEALHAGIGQRYAEIFGDRGGKWQIAIA